MPSDTDALCERILTASSLWGPSLQLLAANVRAARRFRDACAVETTENRRPNPATEGQAVTTMRVGLEHLEKLHANRNIDRRECDEALASAFPLMAAELRELREENHRLGLIAEDHDCLAFPWDGHAPSRRDARVRRETLEEAAKVCDASAALARAAAKAGATGGELLQLAQERDTSAHLAREIRSLASHDTGGGGEPSR